jgi:hypothetical protein
MTYQVKTRFQNLPFKCNLHRYIVAGDGHTYERGAIEGWFARGGALRVERSSRPMA